MSHSRQLHMEERAPFRKRAESRLDALPAVVTVLPPRAAPERIDLAHADLGDLALEPVDKGRRRVAWNVAAVGYRVQTDLRALETAFAQCFEERLDVMHTRMHKTIRQHAHAVHGRAAVFRRRNRLAKRRVAGKLALCDRAINEHQIRRHVAPSVKQHVPKLGGAAHALRVAARLPRRFSRRRHRAIRTVVHPRVHVQRSALALSGVRHRVAILVLIQPVPVENDAQDLAVLVWLDVPGDRGLTVPTLGQRDTSQRERRRRHVADRHLRIELE
mmetsp:Transcript_840/g.2302  ORF Transcript_840/g.2302 Transcript_840/m.2302 type:complete len:273 (-) Transcript_840:1031-1849(-)